MAGDTIITIVGNTTNEVEIRYTASGAACASFTVASTPRVLNRESNTWTDGQALFLRCTAWRQLAEHCSDSLPKGTRVIVTGRLRQRSFETREGEKRTVIECEVDEVGPSLRYATASVKKATRSDGGGAAPGGDPWAGAPAGSDSAPPF